jgi:hypothetical protein
MMETVADWSHDPHGSAWINRMEDRLTTIGPWKAPAAAPQKQNQRA